MPHINENQKTLIDNWWQNHWNGVISSQNRALNWLFTMNTGGVAGILAYAASKENSFFIASALLAFSTGLLFLLGYAARMYYFGVSQCTAHSNDLSDFYSDKITWNEFYKREISRPSNCKLCEVLAWSSALVGVVGVLFSSFAIL